MKYTYSIIEKEVSAINNLEHFFSDYSEYYCTGITSCYEKSLDVILDKTPDFVFINVDNDFDAFNFINDLYKYLKEIPIIIALASSTEYAYLSIKNNFFDYLLKPINKYDLRKSISRLSLKVVDRSEKLCLKSYKDYRFVDIQEILFLKADNNTTDFFMNDGRTISAFKTLKFFENMLPENFTRIHNSYIINQDYVSRIHFGKSECSIKKNHYSIPFSKSYRGNVVHLERKMSKKALHSLN